MRPLYYLLLLGLLAGCANKAASPTPPPAPVAAAPAASAPAAAPWVPGAAASAPAPAQVRASLVAEQRRLSELFRGTPVVFTLQSDGSLKVDVPLGFCFDKGAMAVKPPLAAVLDRLARGQRSEPTKLRVAAALDAGTNNQNLARDRAASARDYLVARGVHATRLTLAPAAQGEGIEIVVSEAATKR